MSDDGTSVGRSSPPAIPPESPGSSVSTRMQEEYTELLRFALTSGLQAQQQTEAEADADAFEDIFKPIASVGSSPRQDKTEGKDVTEQPRTPVNIDVIGNTNSNNLYHDSPNESPEDLQEEADLNVSHQHQDAFASESRITVAGPDTGEMGGKLDSWLGKLKGDILAELSRTITLSLQSQKKENEREIQDLVADKQRLEREATRLGEQVAACEESMARKDALVENLTQALDASKEKVEEAKNFYAAQAESVDERRLSFTEKLASRHHEQQLMQRVLRGWFGQIQSRWRNRVQKGCEEHAREVCAQLSQDYEDKIKSLNSTIESLHHKVAFLQQEKSQYAEQVRKAFMRGVCALNMETMSMFGPEENLELDPDTGHSHPRTVPTGPASYQEESADEKDYNRNALSYTGPESGQTSRDADLGSLYQHQLQHQPQQQQQQQQHYQQHSQARSVPQSEMAYTTGVIDSGTVGLPHRSLSHKTKSKTSKAKVRPATASGSAPTRHASRSGGVANQPLAPPMASIVVERHNPVTKQTLGKATAVRYPKSSLGQVSKSYQPSSVIGQAFRPLAGQTGNRASIKVVD